MVRTDIQNELYPDCPIRNILARISDKWSILILFTLNQSVLMRFNALQKNIPDISQKMLTVTLRTLEEDGFVKRQVYAEVPPRVEYSTLGGTSAYTCLLTNPSSSRVLKVTVSIFCEISGIFFCKALKRINTD